MIYPVRKILQTIVSTLIHHKEEILLVGIFLIAAFFRFYNYPLRYGLDYDATRDALVAIAGAKNFQLPLVGPPSSVGPFHFGPWYYYQLIIANMIIPFDYAPWIYVGIVSLISIFVMYKIGVLLEGKGFGLLLASITTVSPDQIGRANGLSNPNLVGICSALAIWFFIVLLQKERPKWYHLVWGLILGIGINNHFQMLGLLILPFLLYLYKRKHMVTSFFMLVSGLFIAFIPMLLFNLRFQWHTVRMIIYYFLYMRNLTYVPNRWLTYAGEFWPTYTAHVLGIPTILMIGLYVGLVLYILILLYQRRLHINYIFLFIAYIINFIVLRYYGGERLYHNFNYLRPLLFISVGFVVLNLFRNSATRVIGVVFIMLLLLLPLGEDFRRLKPEQSQLVFRSQVKRITELFPNQKYALYHCSTKYDHKALPLGLLLYYDNKLDAHGKKLGILRDECFSLSKQDLQIYNKIQYSTLGEVKKIYQFHKDIDLVDLGNASEAGLLSTGWVPITPDAVYEQAVNWWLHEKP